jgi:acyl-ACP thioesterase
MYAFESRIRYSEVDSHQRLPLTGLANYFQDCSTFHSEDCGLTLDTLYGMSRAWILNSWQIEITRLPRLGETVTIGTWAYDFKGFYGSRNYIMKDSEDKVCAVANSLWVYLNTQTGHPARIQPEIPAAYHIEPKYPMEYANRKIPVPDNLTSKEPFFVVSANIDTNNHVNNSQYILMAEEYLPKDFLVASLRVEYRNAALLGDRIYPKISHTDNQCFVVLENAEEKIYAILVFTGKPAGKEPT